MGVLAVLNRWRNPSIFLRCLTLRRSAMTMGSWKRPSTAPPSPLSWSADEIDRLKKLKAAGAPHSEVYAAFPGRTKHAISAKLFKLRRRGEDDIAVYRQFHGINEEQQQLIVDLRDKGWSYTQIQQVHFLDKTSQAVRAAFKLYFTRNSKREKWTDAELELLMDLRYNQKWDIMSIAKRMSRSYHGVMAKALKHAPPEYRDETGKLLSVHRISFTQEQDSHMMALVGEGASAKEIAAEFPQYEVQSVKHHLVHLKKLHGVAMASSQTAEERQQLLAKIDELLQQGLTWKQIGAHYPHMTPPALRTMYYRSKTDVHLDFTPEIDDKMRSLREQHKSVEAIRRALGNVFTGHRIKARMQELNLGPRVVPFTPADDELIVRLVQGGARIKALALVFQNRFSYDRLRHRVARLENERNANLRATKIREVAPFSDADRTLLNMFAARKSLNAMKNATGISAIRGVTKRISELRTLGMHQLYPKKTKNFQFTAEDDEEIAKVFKSGAKYDEVLEAMGWRHFRAPVMKRAAQLRRRWKNEQKQDGRRYPFTEEQDQKIVDMHNSGAPATQIFDALEDVPEIALVRARIQKLRAERTDIIRPGTRKVNKPFTKKEDQMIINLIRDRTKLQLVAERLNRKYYEIKARLVFLRKEAHIERQRGVTEEEDAKILKMLRAGASKREIATAVGRLESTIKVRTAYFKKKGLYERRPQPFTKEEDEKILALLRVGTSIASIARELGRSSAMLQKRIQALEEQGLVERGKPATSVITSEEDAQLADMVRSGASVAKMQKELQKGRDVSNYTIKLRVAELKKEFGLRQQSLRQAPFTPEEDEKLIALIRAGSYQRDFHGALKNRANKVIYDRVIHLRKTLGVSIEAKKWTPEEDDKLIALIGENATFQKIQEELNVRSTTVIRRRAKALERERGLELNRVYKLNKFKMQKIEATNEERETLMRLIDSDASFGVIQRELDGQSVYGLRQMAARLDRETYRQNFLQRLNQKHHAVRMAKIQEHSARNATSSHSSATDEEKARLSHLIKSDASYMEIRDALGGRTISQLRHIAGQLEEYGDLVARLNEKYSLRTKPKPHVDTAPLGPEHDETIIRMAKEGSTSREIQAVLSSYHALKMIRQRREELGYPEDVKKRFTPEDEEVIIRMSREGATTEDIQAALDRRFTVSGIRKHRKRLGVPEATQTSGFTPEHDSTIIRMCQDGASAKEIRRALRPAFHLTSVKVRKAELGFPDAPQATVNFEPEHDETIIRMTKDGATSKEIRSSLSRSFNLSAIRARRAELGFADPRQAKTTRQYAQFTAEDEGKLRFLIKKGTNLRQISKEFEGRYNYNTLYKRLKELNVATGDIVVMRGGFLRASEEAKTKLLGLRERGASWQEMAEQVPDLPEEIVQDYYFYGEQVIRMRQKDLAVSDAAGEDEAVEEEDSGGEGPPLAEGEESDGDDEFASFEESDEENSEEEEEDDEEEYA